MISWPPFWALMLRRWNPDSRSFKSSLNNSSGSQDWETLISEKRHFLMTFICQKLLMKIITGPLSKRRKPVLKGPFFSYRRWLLKVGKNHSWRFCFCSLVEKSERGLICDSIHLPAISIYYFGDWIMLLLLKSAACWFEFSTPALGDGSRKKRKPMVVGQAGHVSAR